MGRQFSGYGEASGKEMDNFSLPRLAGLENLITISHAHRSCICSAWP